MVRSICPFVFVEKIHPSIIQSIHSSFSASTNSSNHPSNCPSIHGSNHPSILFHLCNAHSIHPSIFCLLYPSSTFQGIQPIHSAIIQCTHLHNVHLTHPLFSTSIHSSSHPSIHHPSIHPPSMVQTNNSSIQIHLYNTHSIHPSSPSSPMSVQWIQLYIVVYCFYHLQFKTSNHPLFNAYNLLQPSIYCSCEYVCECIHVFMYACVCVLVCGKKNAKLT